MKKMVKEIKLNVSNKVTLKYGTMNRENPKVVYINGRTWITPMYEGNYNDAMSYILNKYKKEFKSRLLATGKFERGMIFEFDINPCAMKYGHKKFLSFDIFAKQVDCVNLKDLNNELSECIGNVSDNFVECLENNDFSVSKLK